MQPPRAAETGWAIPEQGLAMAVPKTAAQGLCVGSGWELGSICIAPAARSPPCRSRGCCSLSGCQKCSGELDVHPEPSDPRAQTFLLCSPWEVWRPCPKGCPVSPRRCTDGGPGPTAASLGVAQAPYSRPAGGCPTSQHGGLVLVGAGRDLRQQSRRAIRQAGRQAGSRTPSFGSFAPTS